ncbi:cytidylyltransferase domain-containing protein [Pseudoalteromonas piratica]|uniref:Spore coat protein n=1 Tax=Pseudoalteromonas piratica TaxID=1348114 RepID=A0A0A7EG16_9GAMM|nr:glycosyltransferase family protein [Pseudoalteromonas piratica]AIY64952.1 spore coat protein [Pseudoalteromonas piratica]
MGTTAFIQARMGSSRLPGKVMKPLNGQPVIRHIVSRLESCKYIDKIVVLTSTNPENKVLVDYLTAEGISVFQGDENNVLARFQAALQHYQCDTVLRITGDSPLLDFEICDQLIHYFNLHGADYAYLSEQFAEGVDCEVVKASLLAKLDLAKLRPSEQEHVTLHFYENKENRFHCVELPNTQDDSHYRFTLDTQEDWQVVEAVYQRNSNINNMDYAAVKTYFDQHPEIKVINQHVVRNEGLAISLAQELTGNLNE